MTDFGIEGSVKLTGVVEAKKSLSDFKKEAKESIAALGGLSAADIKAIKTKNQLQRTIEQTIQLVNRGIEADRRAAERAAKAQQQVRSEIAKTAQFIQNQKQRREQLDQSFAAREMQRAQKTQQAIRSDIAKTAQLMLSQKQKREQAELSFANKERQREAKTQAQIRAEIAKTAQFIQNQKQRREIAAAKEADRVVREAKRAATAQNSYAGSTNKLVGAFGNAVSATSLFRTALISLTAAFSVRQIFDYFDVITKLQAATNLYTNNAADTVRVQEELLEVARRSRASFENTINLYQKLSLATRNLGYNSGQVTELVENLQKAIRISGSTFREASAAAQQFAQGVASGNLQGDELRSIRENAPYVAAILEDFYFKINNIRVPLKQLGEDGALTPSFIAAAFADAGDRIEGDFSKLPISMADAFNKFSTEFTALIRDVNNGTNVIGVLAKGIYAIANNLDILIGGFVVFLGARVLGAAIAGVAALNFQMSALNITMLKNPIFAAGFAITAVSIWAFADAIAGVDEQTKKANESITKSEKVSGSLLQLNGELLTKKGELTEKEKTLLEYMRHKARLEIAGLQMQRLAADERIAQIVDEIAKTKELIVEKGKLTTINALSLSRGGALQWNPNDLVEVQGPKAPNEKQGRELDRQVILAGRLAKQMAEIMAIINGKMPPNAGGGGDGDLAKKLAEYRQELTRSVDESERLLKASYLGIEAYEEENALIEAQNEVLKQGVDLRSATGQAILKEIQLKQKNNALAKENLDRFREQEREAKRRREELEKLMTEPYRRAAENIQDAFSGMFKDVFRNGIDGFGDFADRVKDIMLTMVAEIAAAMVFRPILGDVIGGAMGGDQGRIGGIGGISNISNISSLLGGGGSFLPTGMASTIDKVGFDVFGIGKKVSGPFTGATPFTEGISGGASSVFSGGNLLAGFAGSQLASIFGLSGKASGITSTAGGLVGGLVGGPLGAGIGSFLGSALGGLFGGKPSDKGQWAESDFAGMITQTGGLTGKKFSQENMDMAQSFARLGANISAILGDIEGVSQTFSRVQVKVGNRDGSFAQFVNSENMVVGDKYQAQSSGASVLRAMIDGILDNTTGLPAYIADSLRNLEIGDDFDQALKDIQFIAGFESLVNGFGVVEEEMTQTEQVMQQLEEAIKTTRIEVERLNLPLDKFNSGIKKAYQQMRDEVNKNLLDELLGGQSDYYSAYIAEINRHEIAMRDAEAVGADLNIVMAIHTMNMTKLEAQYSNQIETLDEQIRIMEDFTKTAERLGDVLYNIMVGPTSILGPLQQLEMARGEFQDLFQTAMGGGEAGMEAAQSLGAVGEQLINLSKSYFGSSDEVASDFQNVIDSIKTVQDFYQGQGAGVGSLIQQRDQLSGDLNEASLPNSASIIGANKQQIIDAGLYSTVASLVMPLAGAQSSVFDPQAYLAINTDVQQAAAAAGLNPTEFARSHYENYGKAENRALGIDTGQAASFFAGNASLNAAAYQALQQLGVPGFADGGFAPAGKPFVVGENGPELLSFGRPAYITPNMAANDNSVVMAGFMRMIQEQQNQTALMREGFNQMIAEQKRAADAAEESAKTQKRRSAA